MDTSSISSDVNYYNDASSHGSINELYGYQDFNSGVNAEYDSSSISSYKKNYKDYKNTDKGHHVVTRETKGFKPFKVSFYETFMTPGNMIRHAITGLRYSDYRVGSSSEDLFYTVCYSIGDTGSRNPCMLFFDSPSEFESLFRVKVPDIEVKKWTEKMMYEREQRERLANSQGKVVVK